MLKISDLWFAFEHLVDTACRLIPKDAVATNKSKVDLYQVGTLSLLGFDDITLNCNQLLYQHVLHKDVYRRDIYSVLAYLKIIQWAELKRLFLK